MVSLACFSILSVGVDSTLLSITIIFIGLSLPLIRQLVWFLLPGRTQINFTYVRDILSNSVGLSLLFFRTNLPTRNGGSVALLL